MSARIFLDTNTLIYILEGREAGAGITLTELEREANRKGDITLALLEQNSIILGVQVFNELCNVVLRRKFDWAKAKELLFTLEALSDEIVPLNLEVHKNGLLLRNKYQLQLFDLCPSSQNAALIKCPLKPNSFQTPEPPPATRQESPPPYQWQYPYTHTTTPP